MKPLSLVLACLTFFFVSCSTELSLIEPTTDFSANFSNFPYAWTLSKGSGIRVGVVYERNEDSTPWDKLVQRLAPEASVQAVRPTDFLLAEPSLFNHEILFLIEPLKNHDLKSALAAISECIETGNIVILPAYFGPMDGKKDYTSWHNFVRDADDLGAVIVGSHGRAYQLGHTEFWKKVPVDTFALSRRVDGDRFFFNTSLIDSSSLEESAYLVAGAAALLKSHQPELTPQDVKQIFQERGRQVYWMTSDVPWGEKGEQKRSWPLLSRVALERQKAKLSEAGYKILEVIEKPCLDAASILGLKPMRDGEWSARALRTAEAQRMATGQGVVVAILDHMFDPEDPSLQDRTVHPGSVLEGAPVFDTETSSGHGTWMARDLVRIAPDVKIMPVRFCGRGQFGDPELYIKGIEYAVENGADIISISHQPIPEDRQLDFDRAVEAAVKQNVTLVYIHYRGLRTDVVVPSPIEFAPFYKGENRVFVIGTNFIDEMSFPYTWGFSQTAPIVAGVVAMMKEINPELKPVEIRQILLDSGRPISADFKILDAVSALQRSQF